MIVPIGIATYPSFPECQFLTDMIATTTTTKKRLNSHKGHSAKHTTPTTVPTARKAHNGAQKDYDIPVLSR